MFIAVGIGGGLLAARLLNQRDTSGQAGAQADSTVTSRSTPDPTIQPTSSSQSPSDFSDIHEQASQLSGLLAQSGEARSSVVDAVDAVASCTNVSAGANALAAAADSRQDSLNQLDSLETDVLPDGRALVVTLRTALRLSLEADQHFAAWAQSVLHGGCSGSAPRNRHYWAAIEASRGATVAKHHFVRIWNPIATAEGLPAVEETDI